MKFISNKVNLYAYERSDARVSNNVFTTLSVFSVSGKFHVYTLCKVSAVNVSNVFHYRCST